jgi:hypothetical protein
VLGSPPDLSPWSSWYSRNSSAFTLVRSASAPTAASPRTALVDLDTHPLHDMAATATRQAPKSHFEHFESIETPPMLGPNTSCRGRMASTTDARKRKPDCARPWSAGECGPRGELSSPAVPRRLGYCHLPTLPGGELHKRTHVHAVHVSGACAVLGRAAARSCAAWRRRRVGEAELLLLPDRSTDDLHVDDRRLGRPPPGTVKVAASTRRRRTSAPGT